MIVLIPAQLFFVPLHLGSLPVFEAKFFAISRKKFESSLNCISQNIINPFFNDFIFEPFFKLDVNSFKNIDFVYFYLHLIILLIHLIYFSVVKPLDVGMAFFFALASKLKTFNLSFFKNSINFSLDSSATARAWAGADILLTTGSLNPINLITNFNFFINKR